MVSQYSAPPPSLLPPSHSLPLSLPPSINKLIDRPINKPVRGCNSTRVRQSKISGTQLVNAILIAIVVLHCADWATDLQCDRTLSRCFSTNMSDLERYKTFAVVYSSNVKFISRAWRLSCHTILVRCREVVYLVACGLDPHYEDTLTDVHWSGQTEANLHFGKLECPTDT